MKRLASVGLVVLSLLACCAVVVRLLQDTEPPKVKILSDRYDFGEVVVGTVVEHSFTVANEGEGMLIIDRVRTSCGCATMSYPRRIAPGESGEVRLAVDTAGLRASSIQKRGELFTNDPKNRSVVVWIAGVLRRVAIADPANPRLSSLIGARGKATVRIICDRSVTALSVGSCGRLQTSLAKQSGNAEYKLTIDSPLGDIPGRFWESIELVAECDDGNTHLIALPVLYEYHNPIVVDPPRHLLFNRDDTNGLQEREGGVVKEITVESTTDVDFAISVSSENLDAELFRVEIECVEANKKYTVRVVLIKRAAERLVRGSLRIHTDYEPQATIDIPVVALFGSVATFSKATDPAGF